MNPESYFSISFNLIPIDISLGFDLYVNSSSIESKQKFIKIFSADDTFEVTDLERLKGGYPQLYIAESQRDIFLSSISKAKNVNVEEAASIIKDSAIAYLQDIFEPEKEFSYQLLEDTVRKSKVAVESMIDVLDDVSVSGLGSLIGSLSAHDFYTYDHSINVSMYCISLVKLLKPNASRLELVHAGLGGLLHDLGKVKIPTSILNSPSGLTDDEYNVIKTHPTLGLELLHSDQMSLDDELDLNTIGRVIGEHHENWDGTGYPNKLEGNDIHLLARVCAIVDFFDAITTKRSYSDVMPLTKALSVMENTCDRKIDSKIFKIFANHFKFTQSADGKKIHMKDHFDPTIPFAEFPLEEREALFNDKDFGKIRMLDGAKKKKK